MPGKNIISKREQRTHYCWYLLSNGEIRKCYYSISKQLQRTSITVLCIILLRYVDLVNYQTHQRSYIFDKSIYAAYCGATLLYQQGNIILYHCDNCYDGP